MSGIGKEIHVQPRPYHLKPGIKTTEFWISLLVVVIASVIVSLQAHAKALDTSGAVAIASAALTAFGYSRSRALVKSGR